MNNLIFSVRKDTVSFSFKKTILLQNGKSTATMKNEVHFFLNSLKELNICMLNESNVEGG